MELHRKKLEAEMQRFHQGRSSSDLIIDYQNDYLLAQDLWVKAVSDFAVAVDSRERASGRLLAAYLHPEGVRP